MAHTDEVSSASRGTDPLTMVIVGLLALVALAGLLFLLGYAVWWLFAVWAPF